MMRATGDSNGNGYQSKRVSVRTGGAGHAHSGIVKGEPSLMKARSVADAQPEKRTASVNSKIVRLGR
jgi:hypothetical protein